MSKESSNEKEESELKKVADRLYNVDMNHFNPDYQDENDSEDERQSVSEHREIHVEGKEENDKK